MFPHEQAARGRDFHVGIGQFRFSGTELLHLLVSALVLSAIFALPFPVWGAFSDLPGFGITFLFTFLIVGSAFMIHESSHKLTAQYYRVWSEYRMWTGGLIFALLMKVAIGFALIAPGAAYYAGYRRHGPWAIPLTKAQVGRISWAGPVSNIVLAATFFTLSPFLGGLAAVGMSINLSLALFNLIPFGPFDGRAVFSWNWRVWLGTVAAVVGLQYFLLA